MLALNCVELNPFCDGLIVLNKSVDATDLRVYQQYVPLSAVLGFAYCYYYFLLGSNGFCIFIVALSSKFINSLA